MTINRVDPRVLLICDFPPARTLAGQLLLYRLFETYPSGSLRVLSPPPALQRHLPDVRYDDLCLQWRRLQSTRFSWFAAFSAIARCFLRVNAIEYAIKQFRPDVIVTVLHDVAWVAAWRTARKNRLPLAIIVHDDGATFCDRVPKLWRSWARGLVEKTYREAKVRFCISPEMATEYERRYGKSACVLYPSMGREEEKWLEAVNLTKRGRPGHFAYAGSINSEGAKETLALVGRAVVDRGCRMTIFSPSAPQLRQEGRFARHGMDVRDAVSPDELADWIRQSADILVAVVDGGIGPNAALLFPTKLAEYSAFGLPILLCAPPNCAATNWANGPPVRALWINQSSMSSDLGGALAALCEDSALRDSLSSAARMSACETFAPTVVCESFREGIQSGIWNLQSAKERRKWRNQ